MAADVSMQIKNNKSGLITRDFLGVGCFGIDSKELDLDLHVPHGWEKRLDLKSGKVYIQRSNNPANSVSEQKKMANNKENSTKPQDFNVFQQSPSSSSNTKPTLGLLLEQPSLDLKLIPYNNNNNNNSNPPSNYYTSVCTLDKVKSALDRAERASPTLSSSSTSSSSSSKKRWMMMSSSNVRSSSPSNSFSLSIGEEERDSSSRLDHSNDQGLLVAAACPACLLYVLISKNDPKCPKCNSLVHLPTMNKKPKIDLNMSI